MPLKQNAIIESTMKQHMAHGTTDQQNLLGQLLSPKHSVAQQSNDLFRMKVQQTSNIAVPPNVLTVPEPQKLSPLLNDLSPPFSVSTFTCLTPSTPLTPALPISPTSPKFQTSLVSSQQIPIESVTTKPLLTHPSVPNALVTCLPSTLSFPIQTMINPLSLNSQIITKPASIQSPPATTKTSLDALQKPKKLKTTKSKTNRDGHASKSKKKKDAAALEKEKQWKLIQQQRAFEQQRMLKHLRGGQLEEYPNNLLQTSSQLGRAIDLQGAINPSPAQFGTGVNCDPRSSLNLGLDFKQQMPPISIQSVPVHAPISSFPVSLSVSTTSSNANSFKINSNMTPVVKSEFQSQDLPLTSVSSAQNVDPHFLKEQNRQDLASISEKDQGEMNISKNFPGSSQSMQNSLSRFSSVINTHKEVFSSEIKTTSTSAANASQVTSMNDPESERNNSSPPTMSRDVNNIQGKSLDSKSKKQIESSGDLKTSIMSTMISDNATEVSGNKFEVLGKDEALFRDIGNLADDKSQLQSLQQQQQQAFLLQQQQQQYMAAQQQYIQWQLSQQTAASNHAASAAVGNVPNNSSSNNELFTAPGQTQVGDKDLPEVDSEEQHQERIRFLYQQRQFHKDHYMKPPAVGVATPTPNPSSGKAAGASQGASPPKQVTDVAYQQYLALMQQHASMMPDALRQQLMTEQLRLRQRQEQLISAGYDKPSLDMVQQYKNRFSSSSNSLPVWQMMSQRMAFRGAYPSGVRAGHPFYSGVPPLPPGMHANSLDVEKAKDVQRLALQQQLFMEQSALQKSGAGIKDSQVDTSLTSSETDNSKEVQRLKCDGSDLSSQMMGSNTPPSRSSTPGFSASHQEERNISPFIAQSPGHSLGTSMSRHGSPLQVPNLPFDRISESQKGGSISNDQRIRVQNETKKIITPTLDSLYPEVNTSSKSVTDKQLTIPCLDGTFASDDENEFVKKNPSSSNKDLCDEKSPHSTLHKPLSESMVNQSSAISSQVWLDNSSKLPESEQFNRSVLPHHFPNNETSDSFHQSVANSQLVAQTAKKFEFSAHDGKELPTPVHDDKSRRPNNAEQGNYSHTAKNGTVAAADAKRPDLFLQTSNVDLLRKKSNIANADSCRTDVLSFGNNSSGTVAYPLVRTEVSQKADSESSTHNPKDHQDFNSHHFQFPDVSKFKSPLQNQAQTLLLPDSVSDDNSKADSVNMNALASVFSNFGKEDPLSNHDPLKDKCEKGVPTESKFPFTEQNISVASWASQGSSNQPSLLGRNSLASPGFGNFDSLGSDPQISRPSSIAKDPLGPFYPHSHQYNPLFDASSSDISQQQQQAHQQQQHHQSQQQPKLIVHPGSPRYHQIFIYQHQLLIMQFQQYQFQLQMQYQQLSQQQMSPQQQFLLHQQFQQQMVLLQQQFMQQQVSKKYFDITKHFFENFDNSL